MIDDKTLNQFEKEAIEKACCDPTECHWVSTDKKRILTLISAYRESREEIKVLRKALEKTAPEWKSCEHDYEPNTNMDYFRCDKCGARPHEVDALAWEPQGEKE